MTDFQILTAIRNNGGTIGFTDLLNQGLTDPKPNLKADEHRIRNLLSGNCISGKPDAYCSIHMEPNGTALLDQLEENLKQIEQKRADEVAKEKRHRKFTIAITIFSEFLAFGLGFLTHLLFS